MTPGGLRSGNYAISYRGGTLTVDAAPLTVTANDVSRSYGRRNPDFSASYSGFVLGEGPEDLAGELGFATDATRESGVGSYAVTPRVSIGADVANVLDNDHYEAFGGDVLGRRALAHVTYGW